MRIDGRKVDGAAGNHGHVRASDPDAKVRQGAGAREGVTPDVRVVLGALDLAVVGLRDGVVDEHERGAGVGDGGARARVPLLLAVDAEAVRRELPEALGGVDGDVGERAGVLGTVDVAELVGSGGGVLQVGGEDGLGQGGHDVVEEGLLLGRLDGVELAESQAEKAVAVHVLHERRAERRGELDRLSGHRRSSDVHGVGPHISPRATPVAVADAPGGTVDSTESRGTRRIVGGMALSLGGRQLGVEDPPESSGSANRIIR